MTPPAIVAKAIAEGLDMIAVCDHNSARNAAAVQEAAGARLAVLAGMEITTAEECHVVGLFPDAAAAEAAGAELAGSLPAGRRRLRRLLRRAARPRRRRHPRRRRARALAMATPLAIGDVVDLVHGHGGLAVAAHIDRRSFGVIGQLGLFPHDAGFDAVELSRHVAPGSDAEAAFREHGLPILHSSDSHYPDDIGATRTTLNVMAPTFAELALALAGATRPEHRRCMTSRCTCSTYSRTRCAPAPGRSP